MTHLINLTAHVRTGNGVIYWFAKMNYFDRQRVAAILQVPCDFVSVRTAIQVMLYCDTNRIPEPVNPLEYE